MGLVQSQIEAAGISTITLSNMPELTASTSVPRITAIERPFGRTIGEPGDRNGQMAVLRAALQALVEIETPGKVRHLPFDYEEADNAARKHDPPPIVKYLIKHPWEIPNLLNRNVPVP